MLGAGVAVAMLAASVVYLLRARHRAERFTYFTSFKPCNNSVRGCYYRPHFTDEKTEAQRGNRIFPKLPDFIVLGLARDKGSLKQANTFGFFKLVFSKYLVNIYLEVRLGAAQRRMKKSDPGGCLSLSFTLAIPFWSQLA